VEKIGAKMASKLGGKALGVGSGFAVGVGACIEFGPLAVACGIGVAIAAELATDYALTRLDEAITRDSMQIELKQILENTKYNTYTRLVKSFEILLNNLEESFCSFKLVDLVK